MEDWNKWESLEENWISKIINWKISPSITILKKEPIQIGN